MLVRWPRILQGLPLSHSIIKPLQARPLASYSTRASAYPLAFLRRASDYRLAFLRRASVRWPSYKGLLIVVYEPSYEGLPIVHWPSYEGLLIVICKPSYEGLPSAGLLTKGFRLSAASLPTKGFRPPAFLRRASDCRLPPTALREGLFHQPGPLLPSEKVVVLDLRGSHTAL